VGNVGSSRVRRGATLIEVLVVVTIIALIFSLVFTACWPLLHREKTLSELPNAVLVDEGELHIAAFTNEPLQVPADPSLPPEQPTHVPHQYLLRFDPAVPDPAVAAQRLVAAYAGGTVLAVYDSPGIKGCGVYVPDVTSAELASQASRIGAPLIDVERDAYCSICAETTPTGVKRISFSGATPQLTRIDPATLGLPNVTGNLVKSTINDVVIAVIDTGIDGSHPDLTVARSLGFGYPNGNDGNGHGTHVAGIIAARQNNQGVVGVFPGARLWSLRVIGPSGSGTYSDLARALQYVIANANQIGVANISLGGPYSKMINDLVDSCANAGVVMVVAAGNEKRDARLSSPASAAKAVTVAALADTDGKYGGTGRATSYGKDDTFATFSNYGAGVDAIAPGVNIISTLPRNRYGSLSGTSMATPHVAG
jgi:prepilin-type N-terminal cleavage/methylation domain-containing protein